MDPREAAAAMLRTGKRGYQSALGTAADYWLPSLGAGELPARAALAGVGGGMEQLERYGSTPAGRSAVGSFEDTLGETGTAAMLGLLSEAPGVIGSALAPGVRGAAAVGGLQGMMAAPEGSELGGALMGAGVGTAAKVLPQRLAQEVAKRRMIAAEAAREAAERMNPALRQERVLRTADDLMAEVAQRPARDPRPVVRMEAIPETPRVKAARMARESAATEPGFRRAADATR